MTPISLGMIPVLMKCREKRVRVPLWLLGMTSMESNSARAWALLGQLTYLLLSKNLSALSTNRAAIDLISATSSADTSVSSM